MCVIKFRGYAFLRGSEFTSWIVVHIDAMDPHVDQVVAGVPVAQYPDVFDDPRGVVTLAYRVRTP